MGRRWVVLAGVLALSAGCAAGTGTASAPRTTAPSTPATLSSGPTVPPVPGIEGEAVRLRTDEAVGGQVQVRLTATGDDGFTVTSVALDSPGFAPEPPREADTEFAPGRTIDLPVQYGQPRCDVAAEPAAARVAVVRPGGRTEDLRVPLDAEILTRIHEEECAVLALLEVLDVEVVEQTDEDDAVTAQLRLVRRSGGDPVTLERLGRSVLIDVEAPDLPLELDGDGDEVSAAVRFTSATCEPHVLAETKKPYVFPLGVRAGEADAVVMDLPVDEDLRARLAALVDRVCLPA